LTTPEQRSRAHIDAQLVAAGWVVQDYKGFDPSRSRGIALREVPLKSGRCDYLLLVDRKPLGVVEAKKEGPPYRALRNNPDTMRPTFRSSSLLRLMAG
jgi:type I site-specific restriction endonuclease